MNDLSFAVRQLRRNPGFTAVAVLTLALGIGLVSTQFSLIDGVLLRPLPFRDSDRLFHVARASDGSDGGNWRPMPIQEFLAVHEHQEAFDDLAAFHSGTFNLNHPGGAPRHLRGQAVTPNFFSLLRTPPQVGRVFRPGDDAPGQPVFVVLAHGVWQEEFGGDPSVVGRPVRINGEAGTIIGVMPSGFGFPARDDCWVSLRPRPEVTEGWGAQSVEAIGLLRPGVSKRAAAENLSLIANRLAGQARDQRPIRLALRSIPMAHAGSGTAPVLGTMLAMTFLVLSLACGNVANLLIVRTASRLRELAVRTALGAGRARLFRQLLTESLVLAGAGAAVGTLLAIGGVRFLNHHVITRMETASWIRFQVDGRVLALTAALAIVSGLIAGLLPALRAARLDLNETLRDESRGVTGLRMGRFSRWLVGGQLAFACGSLVAAMLLALNAVGSSRVNLAFDPDHLLIGRLELEGAAYQTPEQRVQFYNQLIEQVRRIPGVAAAAVSSRDLGIVPDLNMEGVGNNDPPSGWYLLQDQQAWGWLDLLVRAQGKPHALVGSLRAAVAKLDPNQPIHTITTLGERTSRRVAGLQIVGTMATVFAVVALALAGISLYGVMAFAVERRTREFGVRLALGATGRSIFHLLFRQSALHTLAGIAAGLGLGYVLSLPLAPFLAKADAGDPSIYALVAFLLIVVAVLAILVPANRAARLDPMDALRQD